MENNNSTKGFLHPLTDARIFMAEAMKREDAEAKKCEERKTDREFIKAELQKLQKILEARADMYIGNDNWNKATNLLSFATACSGALELLKAQEAILLENQMPRILTQQEVFSTDFDGHVYVEILGVITPALVTWKTREIKQNWFATPRNVTERFIATQQLEGNWLVEEDYGITWRCWNIMPSAEDCKNAPWDVQESNQAASEDPKAKKCEEKMLSDIYLAASDELDRVKKDTVMVDQLVKDTAGKDPRIDPTKLTYDVNISQNGEIVETHRIVGLGKAHEFGEKRIKELGGDAGYGVWLR